MFDKTRSLKLTDEQVCELRNRYLRREGTIAQLAVQFGVSEGYAARVIRGEIRRNAVSPPLEVIFCAGCGCKVPAHKLVDRFRHVLSRGHVTVALTLCDVCRTRCPRCCGSAAPSPSAQGWTPVRPALPANTALNGSAPGTATVQNESEK